MTRHNLQEPLKTFPAMLNDVVAESVGENLARKRGNSDSCALSLEDIAEVFKVRVTSAHDGVFQLKGGDIGSADYLVGCVHIP